MPSNIDEMNVASGVPGVQVPSINDKIKEKKKNIDELLELHEDINEGSVLSYLHSLDEQNANRVSSLLDNLDYCSVANEIREHIVRSIVENKVREIVRKKKGGGGYILYSPNKGKKKPSKPVGEFPTKLGAKQAELARFPPKDASKLNRMRTYINRLLKDPKKRAEAELKSRMHKESVENESNIIAETMFNSKDDLLLRTAISHFIMEGIFQGENTGSAWDEHLSQLSSKVLSSDSKFMKLQKSIEKRTEKLLQDSFYAISKALKKNVKLKNYGIKKDEDETILEFAADFSDVTVEPIYIRIDNIIPRIDVTQNAKMELTKVNAEAAKMFRAELISVQEQVLDKMDDLKDAILARDRYLDKTEEQVDDFVANLSSLQVSMLKRLLSKKYRKAQ